VRGDFGVTIPGAVCEIYFSGALAMGVQDGFDAVEALLRSEGVFGGGLFGYEGGVAGAVDGVQGNLAAKVRAIAAVLIDGEILYGVYQKRFFVGGDGLALGVDVQTQHGFLDEIFGVFVRAAFAP
jgi:hypothetical protein